MIITYYGAYCVKVQSGDTVLVFNPPSKKSAFKSPRFQADAIFVSSRHEDFDGVESIAGEPFLIDGPGEYEIKGIRAAGISSSPANTIYRLDFENTTICHLGIFSEKELRSEIREALGEIDVLLVSSRISTRVINQIEPAIVIPLFYTNEKELKDFLKNAGQEKTRPLDKFSFKKKDIAGKNQEIVVLKPTLN